MADKADRVTRTAADLYGSAVAEGVRQRRSVKPQLDHWARVGRAVSSRHTAARQKVEAALDGELALAELSEEEGAGLHRRAARAAHPRIAGGARRRPPGCEPVESGGGEQDPR